MRTLKTSEAAAVLNVSPNTLRAWERRFGFPKPRRSPGKHRIYTYAEIVALREALEEGLSISSAVSVAREAYGTDGHALIGALTSFRPERADAAMEASLSLRSVEHSVEEVLLPALGELRRRRGTTSAAWAFAAAWAGSWLERARRLAPVANRRGGVLIGDASGADTDPARPYVRALDLCVARTGLESLVLPVAASGRVSDAVAAIDPGAVIIAGARAGDDEVARWAYAVHSAAGRVPFLLYHRGGDPLDAGSRARTLPPAPTRAAEEILFSLGSEAPPPAELVDVSAELRALAAGAP
jgi:DNA-binding transcriptional MerR regulator